MTEIICTGYGGQGVLVIGHILAFAGMTAGNKVTWYPSYGSEMRGGTANCNVKIDTDEIASPYVKAPDILISMNEVSLEKFEKLVKPGGVIIVNSSLCDENRVFRSDVRVVKVPANDIANDMGNSKGGNIAMLGAAVKASGAFELQQFAGAIDGFFAQKGKFNPKNVLCFEAGAKCAE
ncbi:MAG: 2-oxoacid:acceptor oxidoreductase family protein [Oscillospiraceae bacterium]